MQNITITPVNVRNAIIAQMAIYYRTAVKLFSPAENVLNDLISNLVVNEPAIESGLSWVGSNAYLEISVTGREGFALLPLRGDENIDYGFNLSQIQTAASSILFGALGADAFDKSNTDENEPHYAKKYADKD